MIYALDTNVIIDLLNGKSKDVTDNFNTTVNDKTPIDIPPFVNYEMLKGFYHTSAPGKYVAYVKLCSNCIMKEMTVDVWQQAAKIHALLRKTGLTVEDADILIAAFCIVNEYTLVTHNTKDFNNIKNLQITDWKKN